MRINLRDLRIGWRVLVKEPAYSAVVLLGLAVGIAACFLLLGFVRHSFSYDRQVPEHDRIYLLQEHWNVALLGDGWSGDASLAARDAAAVSGQPVLVSYFYYRGLDVRTGVHVESLRAALADPDFETIFKPTVLAGDLHAALTRPDALALTRASALKLFGRVDVAGAALRTGQRTYTVAAVLEDQPAASTMPFDALAGMDGTVMAADTRAILRHNWGLDNGRIFIKMLPGADPRALLETVRRGLRQSPLVKRDFAEQVAGLNGRDLIEYRLMPMAEAYLAPDVKDDPSLHGNRHGVLGLAAIALLVLLLAGANYVNLATVRTLARQREIAMRKVLGASSRVVARQFLTESVLVCLIATVLGLLMAWLVLPVFSDLVQRRFDDMFSPATIALALGLGMLLGLVGGVYPTWSALGVRTTAALAGRASSESAQGLWLRRALTTLQFGVAMGLTAATLAVAWQTRYTTALDPGFDPAPLLMFPVAGDMREPKVQALREAIARLPGVAGVAESQLPFSIGNNIIRLHREGGDGVDVNQYAVSPEFFGVYGVRPVAGRLYDPARDKLSDGGQLVINAMAARQLGFATPEDAVGKTVSEPAGNRWQVAGVAPDVRHRSARERQQPTLYRLHPRVNMFTVRCNGDVDAVKRAVEDLWPRYFPNETLSVVRARTVISDLFYADDLRLAKLLAVASVIATAIAAFGIYVLAAYSVQRREKEIVLRKLYGAGRTAIGGLVAREFALLVGAGAVLGLPLAWIAIARYLGAFSERAPVGAWTLLAALLVAGAVALLSTLRHALAALRIRPALALRE